MAKFTVIGEEQASPGDANMGGLVAQQSVAATSPHAVARKEHTAAIQTLMLLLNSLSQRAVISLAQIRTLLSAGAVFWLWMTIPDPSIHQLIGMGMFAIFILVINWLWRA